MALTKVQTGLIEATGTPSSTTFLRGDGSWATPTTAGPAFSAYYTGAGQSVVTNTFVKLILNTEEFDTNNNFDSTTNYRFTPTVAGYYQLNGQIGFTTWVAGGELSIFKNGAQFKNGTNTNNSAWASVSSVIYLNGTTDYVELYIAHTSGSTQTSAATSQSNYFNGALIRSA